VNWNQDYDNFAGSLPEVNGLKTLFLILVVA
jgi:hypothetical protein